MGSSPSGSSVARLSRSEPQHTFGSAHSQSLHLLVCQLRGTKKAGQPSVCQRKLCRETANHEFLWPQVQVPARDQPVLVRRDRGIEHVRDHSRYLTSDSDSEIIGLCIPTLSVQALGSQNMAKGGSFGRSVLRRGRERCVEVSVLPGLLVQALKNGSCRTLRRGGHVESSGISFVRSSED
jgi:hypothetical protein